jgi:hypothetical protein
VEYIGLKRQVKITSKLIKPLQELVPSAANYPLETRFNRKQAWLWGAILRLPLLEGEHRPPVVGNSSTGASSISPTPTPGSKLLMYSALCATWANNGW